MGGHPLPNQHLLRQLEDIPEWLESEPKPQVQKSPCLAQGSPTAPLSMADPVLEPGPGADSQTSDSGIHLLQIPELEFAT